MVVPLAEMGRGGRLLCLGDLTRLCRSGARRRGLRLAWSWKVGSCAIEMGDPHQKHHGLAVFLASFQRRALGRKRRFWAPPPRTRARAGKYAAWFHAGVTSHLCEVCSPQPAPESIQHIFLHISPYSAPESLAPEASISCSVGMQAGVHVPLLPWRLTRVFCANKTKQKVFILLQAPR